ncbi:hypothetical protein RJT34_26463 [Clitoria ternatea]|uniref:Uncharacterized protein n=1 Tax=Clitoria ternatea TaxID=43366 RepID=A0AAN9F6V9_CLITE
MFPVAALTRRGETTLATLQSVFKQTILVSNFIPILELVPTPTTINVKGSCAGANPNGHSTDIDIVKKCELLVDGVDDPVVIGMVYHKGSLVHYQPLSNDISRVS